MEVFLTKDKLPNNNEYVLAYFKDRPWSSPGTDQHKWVVVQFIRGISLDERSKLLDSDTRKKTYRFGDEWGNNEVPYEWDTFGPNSFFGQEAVCWCALPTPLKEK
jgi:hypothetical protein